MHELSNGLKEAAHTLDIRQSRLDLADSITEDDNAALTVRALLMSIEKSDTVWYRLATEFRDDAVDPTRIVITPDTPFAYPLPPLADAYRATASDRFSKSHLITRPGNIPNSYRIDSIAPLSLGMQTSSEISIVLDLKAGDMLDEALISASAPLMSAAHPRRTISDFTIPEASSGPMFPIRITEPEDETNSELVRLFTSAQALNFPICGAPELSCLDSTLDAVLSVDARSLPPVVHLGSTHVSCGTSKYNRAYLVFPHHQFFIQQDKLSRYTFRQGPDHSYPESIDLGREIRVCWGKNWSLAMLTCADFLDPEVRQIVVELRPTFIIIGAMSEKTALFNSFVSQLVADCQSHAMVVNGPRGWDDDVIFGQPVVAYDNTGVEQVVRSRCDRPDTALAHVRRGTSDIVWTPASM